MTIADAIMYGAVGLCALAALRTPAPLVLLAWWAMGMALWAAGMGQPAAVEVSLCLDLAAGAAIIVFRRSHWDLVAASLFLPTWAAYLALDGMPLWWASWLMGCAQFLLVSFGALADYQREKPIRDRLHCRRRRRHIRRGMRFEPC